MKTKKQTKIKKGDGVFVVDYKFDQNRKKIFKVVAVVVETASKIKNEDGTYDCEINFGDYGTYQYYGFLFRNYEDAVQHKLRLIENEKAS